MSRSQTRLKSGLWTRLSSQYVSFLTLPSFRPFFGKDSHQSLSSRLSSTRATKARRRSNRETGSAANATTITGAGAKFARRASHVSHSLHASVFSAAISRPVVLTPISLFLIRCRRQRGFYLCGRPGRTARPPRERPLNRVQRTRPRRHVLAAGLAGFSAPAAHPVQRAAVLDALRRRARLESREQSERYSAPTATRALRAQQSLAAHLPNFRGLHARPLATLAPPRPHVQPGRDDASSVFPARYHALALAVAVPNVLLSRPLFRRLVG